MNFTDILTVLAIAISLNLGRIAVMNRWMFSYRITEHGIDVLLFNRIVRKRVRFDNIASMEILIAENPMWAAPLPGWHMTFEAPNTLRGPFVQIEQKTWRINRYVLISPDDPREFVRTVRQHMTNKRSNPSE